MHWLVRVEGDQWHTSLYIGSRTVTMAPVSTESLGGMEQINREALRCLVGGTTSKTMRQIAGMDKVNLDYWKDSLTLGGPSNNVAELGCPKKVWLVFCLDVIRLTTKSAEFTFQTDWPVPFTQFQLKEEHVIPNGRVHVDYLAGLAGDLVALKRIYQPLTVLKTVECPDSTLDIQLVTNGDLAFHKDILVAGLRHWIGEVEEVGLRGLPECQINEIWMGFGCSGRELTFPGYREQTSVLKEGMLAELAVRDVWKSGALTALRVDADRYWLHGRYKTIQWDAIYRRTIAKPDL